MMHHKFLKPLEKVLRFYAGFGITVFLFQLAGLLMYFVNGWPQVRSALSTGVTILVGLAVVSVLARSCIWIRIYWVGARAFSLLRGERESPDLVDRLAPVLTGLSRLLVMSCFLDLFFVPFLFLGDVLRPFAVSWWGLGLVDLSILLFPQAFGVAALILAFLTHQYAQLLRERSQMKEEIALTI